MFKRVCIGFCAVGKREKKSEIWGGKERKYGLWVKKKKKIKKKKNKKRERERFGVGKRANLGCGLGKTI